MSDSPVDQMKAKAREAEVITALRMVYDPEIPVNIYDLGLIYGIDFDSEHKVRVTMTMTSPNCPVAETLPGMVRAAVEDVEEIHQVDVEVVWEPPWNPELMSEEAKLQLGFM